MWNSKRFIAAAEITTHFFITATFSLSYDFPHDFAGNGVFSDLNGVHQSDICRFRAMALSPLNLVVNWPVFTINICFLLVNLISKVHLTVRICQILKWVICAILWVMCAILYFGCVVVCSCTKFHCQIIQTLSLKDF